MTHQGKRVFSFSNWKKFFSSFSKKEKIILFSFLFLALVSSFFLIFGHQSSKISQPAFGGTYREGVIGQPAFINPLYSVLNDPDRDPVNLIFSGLMKYDQEGKIIPDLAEEYSLTEEGKVYEFTLRENLVWHDGQPLTTDDVVFTIKTIQNPASQSPLRSSWFNVEVEKITDRRVRFTLSQPYPNFLETAVTKIIPKHIWKETPARSLALATASPSLIVGSGPFKFEKIESSQGRVETLNLEANSSYYFPDRPYLAHFSFHYFTDEEELLRAAQLGKIDGFLLDPSTNWEKKENFSLYQLEIPQYFSVFFNPDQSNLLAQTRIRQALSYSIDRQAIIDQIFQGQAAIVESPLLPDFYSFFSNPSSPYNYDPQEAEEIFEGLGFKKEEESNYRVKTIIQEVDTLFKSDLQVGSQGQEVRDLQKCLAQFPEIYPSGKVTGYFGPETKAGVIKFQEEYAEDILDPWGFSQGTGLVSRTTREKLNEICGPEIPAQTLPLEFTLTTVDQPQLKTVAKLLQAQWAEVGVKISLEIESTSILESEIINPREYEALLFGETLTMQPDLYPFWHSSKRLGPGLNLALYHNEEADELLKIARSSIETETIVAAYEEFQEHLLNDAPAVFLYRPFYQYYLSSRFKINFPPTKVAEPSQRLAKAEDWYLKTK